MSDKKYCTDCRGEMTLLLYSFVCDHCEAEQPDGDEQITEPMNQPMNQLSFNWNNTDWTFAGSDPQPVVRKKLTPKKRP